MNYLCIFSNLNENDIFKLKIFLKMLTQLKRITDFFIVKKPTINYFLSFSIYEQMNVRIFISKLFLTYK